MCRMMGSCVFSQLPNVTDAIQELEDTSIADIDITQEIDEVSLIALTEDCCFHTHTHTTHTHTCTHTQTYTLAHTHTHTHSSAQG